MTEYEDTRPAGKKRFSKLSMKPADSRFFAICFLALLFYIPLGMIDSVTDSRMDNLRYAVQDVSGVWGESEQIAAPIISIPVRFTYEESIYNDILKRYEKKPVIFTRTYAFLPEDLNIEAELVPEMRHKGIYNVLVYTARLHISGNFGKFDIPSSEKVGQTYKILWDEASLNIGIDASQIRGHMEILFDGQSLSPLPGTRLEQIEGISAPLSLKGALKESRFSISLQLNGRETISFAPLGKKNSFEVVSSWPDPYFSGAFRPQSPEISENGFKAKWEIPYIARNYPQIFSDSNKTVLSDIQRKTAKVGLYEEMPLYRNIQRLSSYGIMFVALTFIMMFLFERGLKQNLHYAQYAVTGLSLSLFFLTLLSLSEHICFGISYVIASLIVISMISLYLYGALKNKAAAFFVGFILAVIYVILYLMFLESDYALLIGTALLLITMGFIMWQTRCLNAPAENE